MAGTRRGRRAAFRAGAAALAALAVVSALEIGLRVHHAAKGTYAAGDADVRDWTASEDPELVYVNRPGLVAYGARMTEAHGILRPEDVATTKPPGALRLAVIGDSVGAAEYLPYARRFTTLLEDRLTRELSRPVEALNFCVEGYATVQEARLLETSVSSFDVDAVLLVYCLNDAGETLLPLRSFRAAAPPTCYALDFVARALRKDGAPLLAPVLGPQGPLADHWRRMYADDGAGWAGVERGLDRIAAWSKAKGVPVVAVIAPLLLEDDPEGRSTASFRRQAADALTARGLACVDLQETCAAAGIPRLAARPGDIYHFGETGQVVLAEATLPLVRRALGR